MKSIQVKDLMTDHPFLISPDATLTEACKMMRDINCGVLPVGTEKDIKGIITDRDIIIRAISEGKNAAKEHVKDYMTQHIYGCNENDYLEDAAEKMRQYKVSRLIVRNKTGKVVGILSFGGILRKDASANDVASVVKHATGSGVI